MVHQALVGCCSAQVDLTDGDGVSIGFRQDNLFDCLHSFASLHLLTLSNLRLGQQTVYLCGEENG